MKHDVGKRLVTLRPAAGDPLVRLVCFPFAGGGPDVFRPWAGALDARVELLSVRLPGRGRRIAEEPYREWEPLLDDAWSALAPLLAEPHAFYGHCFGGRLAWELTRRAAAEHPGATRRLFVAGCRSPGSPQQRPLLHALPDDELIAELRRTGATPAEVLDNPRMTKVFLPVLRGDITLAETWDERRPDATDVPVTAVFGREDRVDDEAGMRGWKDVTRGGCELLGIDGGHFFPETHRPQLIEILNARLEETWRR